MRIWRLKVGWVKRDVLGRPLHDWEIVTLDQLTPHARQLITKMARVAARDFYEEMREEWLDLVRAEVRAEYGIHRAKMAVTVPPPAEAKKRVRKMPLQKEGDQP